MASPRRPNSRKRPGKLRAALLIALIPGAVGVLLSRWAPGENLERGGLDVLFQIRGPLPSPDRVRVVALDDDSYPELGVKQTDSWPRALHATLIRTLQSAGASSIAFDVLFEEPRDAAQDEELQAALSEAGNVVLASTVDQVDDPRFRRLQMKDPYPPFAEAAAAVGNANFSTDRDGIIRTASMSYGGHEALSLAAVRVAAKNLQARDTGPRLIDYYGPPRTIPTVSYYQALDPAQYLPPDYFKDKVVFVGLSQATATGISAKDAFLTPFRGAAGDLTFGVEVHATVAANLLEGRRIRLLPRGAEAAMLLLLPLAATLVFLALRPLWGVLAFGAMELGTLALTGVGFARWHFWLPVVIPCAIQLPIAGVLCLGWYYLTTVRERERIKRAFSLYLSPEMTRRIAASPDSLNLGGEEIVATALFTDLKGFTTIAESLSAHQTAALLNDYFSKATRHIFEAEGTLIKYIGDAVFALWGAPLRMDDHATRACRAALELARDRKVAEAVGLGEGRLITRIGVHTGAMVVGNLGSAQRFDYTAIGDAVNLASRLESLNKAWGTVALVSGETFSRTGGAFLARRLGRARVVGRGEPVELFELLGLKGEESPLPAAALRRFQEALEDYTERRLERAAEGFRQTRDLLGGRDGPSELYLDLLTRFAQEPPADWDGVVHFETK
ncbi:MAG TPA: adenylate/guanylate cyclase domain-containing protein [Candidatus Polarisedimenticolia bacterium]|nr:adenylate/guanylate cyclase domain-containing protein [Candidatus Polarisedimenticolia bacterium]